MAKKRRSRQFKDKNQVIDIEHARHERRKRRNEAVKVRKKVKVAAPVSKRRATKSARRRLIYLAIILGLLAVIAFTAFHLLGLQKEIKAADEQKQVLEKEKSRLENELNQVNSQDYVEDKARSELHMIKPGETIYVAPQEDEQTSGAAADSGDGKLVEDNSGKKDSKDGGK